MHLFTTENVKQLLKFKMHPKNQRKAQKCVHCMDYVQLLISNYYFIQFFKAATFCYTLKYTKW